MKMMNLFEGVVINNPIYLAAYAITVAEAYDQAPRYSDEASASYSALKAHNVNVLFNNLKPKINIVFTQDDPYAQETDDPDMMVRYMLYDMLINNTLKVYTGYSDDHPEFTEKENIIFRTVHDYYTHAKLLKPFKEGLMKIIRQLGRTPTQDELKHLLPQINLSKYGNIGHSFSFRGELNSYVSHSRIAPNRAIPALFTEIVGQVSYNIVCSNFPKQKAVILHGFDYQNIGKCIEGSGQEGRMLSLIEMIGNKQEIIPLNIKAKKSVHLDILMRNVTRR